MNYWNKLSFLPQKELKNIQNKILRDFINNQLYPFSPYYRKLLDRYNINPRQFQDVWNNNDKKADRVAKNILSDKYEWMENEIIR